ncbi:FAD-binding oxidoreductase [Pyxidicoccus fallax]|uniref:FAD-binding oxidoreductase n=1 Tax=Pyxidicoccus fallax TaxID=394095 RepID=A0A848L7N6_9BACT|nr:FAD-binding oxidoreductase [Pyxidicoccus fallax]NMO14644.1 FAD-binding oxidoreductase [Pyxidicoccus fallax]NPC79523.1 FAD-binding oxidoreductase [Pyxidicoccus fallax]
MAPHPASLLDELRAGISAPVTIAPDALERYGHDFGGLVRRVPSVVVQARREADVVHTLKVARALSGRQGPGRLYAVGLDHGVRAEDRRGIEAAVAAHRQCLEWTVRAGGRPYLYGWHPLAPESRAALYGDDLARLRALRDALDPDGLLNPHGLHWGDLAAEGAR